MKHNKKLTNEDVFKSDRAWKIISTAISNSSTVLNVDLRLMLSPLCDYVVSILCH